MSVINSKPISAVRDVGFLFNEDGPTTLGVIVISVAISLIIFLTGVVAINLLLVPEVEYLNLDGMPCVQGRRGMDCDWSRWDGER